MILRAIVIERYLVGFSCWLLQCEIEILFHLYFKYENVKLLKHFY